MTFDPDVRISWICLGLAVIALVVAVITTDPESRQENRDNLNLKLESQK